MDYGGESRGKANAGEEAVSFGVWKRAGKELIQEKDFGVKFNSTGRGLHLKRRR